MRTKRIIFLLLTLLLIFIVFFPCLQADFVNWDDDQLILKNPHVALFSFENTVDIFRSTVGQTYAPLTVLMFNLEHRLFGLNPFFYHLNNLLLHLGVVGLIFFLALELDISLLAAALAALVFGLHPMHVESVAWVTERKDVLYSFFYLLSLLAYCRYLKTGRRAFYGLGLFCGLLSILSKAMALSLPWILLLCDARVRRRFEPRFLLNKIPFLLLIVPVTAVTFLHHQRPPTVVFPQSLWIWLWSFTFYLKKFFVPLSLSPLYELPNPIALTNPEYALALGLTALLLAALVIYRRHFWFIFALSFYFGSLFFLFRASPQSAGVNPVADRFMYLPSLGICFFIAVAIERFSLRITPRARKMLFYPGLGALLLIFAVISQQQCAIWRSPETLWGFLLERFPDSSIAHNNSGERLAYSGRHLDAIEEFSRAIALSPRNYEAYYNKGVSLTLLEQYDEAMKYYNQAIGLNPDYDKALNNRAFILLRVKGQPDAALADLNLALRLNPYLAEAYHNRGMVHEGKQNIAAALTDYSLAVKYRPGYADAYYSRGLVYGEIKNDPRKAIEDFSRAIQIDPAFEEALVSRGFAWTQLGDRTRAESDFQAALKINPRSFAAHLNIGTIFLERQEYPRALAHYEKAVELSPQHPLAHFLNGKALRLLGRLDDARDRFTTAIKMNADYAEAYYERGLAWKALQNKEKALNDLLKAQELGFTPTTETLKEEKNPSPVIPGR